MSEFDDNIPVPPIASGPKRKYQWDKMEIGQSLFVEGEKEGKNAYSAAKTFEKSKAAIVMVIRAQDGTIVVPVPGCTVRQWLAQADQAEKEHGPLWTLVGGRKSFVGRQMDGGWRIWRAKDLPIRESDTVTSPLAPNVRWMKEDI